MERASLLLSIVMFLFINLGFTREQEIVNPPRPTKKFKKLLIVKHEYRYNDGTRSAHTHFIYTNDFLVIKQELKNYDYQAIKLVVDVDAQKCSDNFVTQQFGCELQFSGSAPPCYLFLYSNLDPKFLQGFFVMKAPRSLIKSSLLSQRGESYPLKPQKAKIVFK